MFAYNCVYMHNKSIKRWKTDESINSEQNGMLIKTPFRHTACHKFSHCAISILLSSGGILQVL